MQKILRCILIVKDRLYERLEKGWWRFARADGGWASRKRYSSVVPGLGGRSLITPMDINTPSHVSGSVLRKISCLHENAHQHLSSSSTQAWDSAKLWTRLLALILFHSEILNHFLKKKEKKVLLYIFKAKSKSKITVVADYTIIRTPSYFHNIFGYRKDFVGRS